ncbi:class III aminotransferase [Cryptococcus neoformans Tu401-1]|nr:class III aminotransferase [Cryptococcus neoformans var. grubii Tu401-1]
MARQYWVEAGKPERKYIIARFPSYHGNTLGALAIGNAPGRRDIYRPLISLAAFHHVTSPVYRRYAHPGETEEAYSARLADELEAKILELGPENVIGFFAEPVVGSALGVMPPPKGYFPAMEKVIKKYGTLFIMDEVMSGSGRVGQLFAHQAVGEGVKPDIVAIAKGLGGGYVSISGVFVGQSVADRVREGGQWKNSHTYQNHPINCAVAAKVMEIVEREDLLQNVRERGEQILEELKEAAKGVPTIIDVRGKGLFIGVELDGPSSLKPRLASRVKDQAFKNGLIVMGISGTIDGVEGETTIICPAYTVTKEQISGIVRLLMKSVKEVVEEL